MHEITRTSMVGVPYLTTDQMREVDRLMVEEYGIVLLQMMENAGRGLARLARDRFLGGDARGRRVAVLVGSGGNGGVGFCLRAGWPNAEQLCR
jgi:NAD(P)H-hydrate epimerase